MPPQSPDHRAHLDAIRAAALQAVDPERAVRAHLALEGTRLISDETRIDLTPASRVIVVGAGKAGVAMARAAADALGDRLAGGVLSVPRLPRRPIPKIDFVQGGHPAPTEATLEAGRRIARALEGLSPDDRVIALISGGGSALMELLPPGISLADLQAATAALLKSGATINELNTVRKAISQIKGGGLARMAAPARVLALILSDVVGDPLDVIASGPTVPSPAAPAAALGVIERHGLAALIPASVMEHLRTASDRPQAAATVEPPEAVNVLVGSNAQAAEAAAARAAELGFNAMLLSTFVEGEAREIGRTVAGLGKGVRRHGHPVRPPACLVMGGETTVTVRGTGKGGRNQELALAAAIALEGWEGIAVMSFGTDGIDGPTDAAGAMATGDTIGRAKALSLSAQTALANNDAHPFFASLGDLIVTGPTGTNVNDLMVVLVY